MLVYGVCNVMRGENIGSRRASFLLTHHNKTFLSIFHACVAIATDYWSSKLLYYNLKAQMLK